MAHDLFPNGGDPTQERDRGLRFTNDEWNGSISNGQPVTLRWNESLPIETAQLNLFKVIYPEQGLVMYDMVSNLSGEYACWRRATSPFSKCLPRCRLCVSNNLQMDAGEP